MAMQEIEKVNLAQKLELITTFWTPKIIGELNDSYIKVVKLHGEFVWHHHAEEDELFLVLKGRLVIQLRERNISLEPGEFVIIPHGVEHCPLAADEVHILLLEPKTTLNTGTVRNERTAAAEWI